MRTDGALVLANTSLEFSEIALVLDQLGGGTGRVTVNRNNPKNPLTRPSPCWRGLRTCPWSSTAPSSGRSSA
jgi:hypothetical protein